MKLSKQKRGAKLKEREQMARKKRILERSPIKIPRDQIARLDAETIAIDGAHVTEAIKLLTKSGFKFWPFGPLSEVCCRLEHDDSYWLES